MVTDRVCAQLDVHRAGSEATQAALGPETLLNPRKQTE